MYRIMTSAVCIIVLSQEIAPICLALSGSAIAFEGKDMVMGDLEDKYWMKLLKDFFNGLSGKSRSLLSDSGIDTASYYVLDQSFSGGEPTSITLTLYVHDGSANGSAISDANVEGQDGSGNSFQQTTDSNGHVTIKGDPGTWSFSVSASGYGINNWDQEIIEDCTKHVLLHEKQQHESAESSVVGKWRFNPLNCQCLAEEMAYGCSCDPYEMTFNEDGTFIDDKWSTGKWVKYGDTIRYSGDQFEKGEVCSCIMEGTVVSDTMIVDKNYCPCDMYKPQKVTNITGLSSRESKRIEMGMRLV